MPLTTLPDRPETHNQAVVVSQMLRGLFECGDVAKQPFRVVVKPLFLSMHELLNAIIRDSL